MDNSPTGLDECHNDDKGRLFLRICFLDSDYRESVPIRRPPKTNELSNSTS
jgi:hypothetical protein